ncbi:efflux transporter outer membrane subunit [Ramlibacter sp. AN1133]|uniref:efflux transporter outer membrane subunit n=1 Tax=Ramlibacter sp. AN1133 TaxID=3133429 RepID=UPI0030BAF748
MRPQLLALAALAAVPALHAQALPEAWQGALPHGGDTAALRDWWAAFDDPLLVRLIEAAQAASPDLAAATARIAQARANRIAAGAALLPAVDASAGAARGRDELGQPLARTTSAGLQMAWELDLAGGNRAGARAAQARLQAADAGWHEARVALAAETASGYVALRACQARLVQAEIDVASREETARLTAASAQFGLQTAGNVALARASAAQARAGATQRRGQCETLVNALVAATGMEAARLRAELAASTARLPHPPGIAVTQLPAQALAQRPDLHAAERNLLAAGEEVTQTRAQQLPRLALQGNFGFARATSSLGSADGSIWSFGPISLVLPVFDAGRRAAASQAARARYDEALSAYQARARQAVREVEDALQSLQGTEGRAADARIAAEGFRISLQATDARYRGGLASLFELEEARRSDVQAQVALIDLEEERTQAWITLYRALGGGWQAPGAPTASLAPETPL